MSPHAGVVDSAGMHRPPARDQGFTLLELLSVVVIIGLLAAIAVPTFFAQRRKAMAASARSMLRDLATSEEAYLTEHGVYGDLGELDEVPSTKDVTVRIVSGVGSPEAFCATAEHRAGGGAWYFDSDGGGLLASGVACT